MMNVKSLTTTDRPICNVFGEIPVSPNLKSRVRQRLFSLVNHIDGYTPSKDNLGYESHCRCKENGISQIGAELNNQKNNTQAIVKNTNFESPIKTYNCSSECVSHKEKIYSMHNINDTNILMGSIPSNMKNYEEDDNLNMLTDDLDLRTSLYYIKQNLHDVSKVLSLLQLKVHSLEKDLVLTKERHKLDIEMLKIHCAQISNSKQKQEDTFQAKQTMDISENSQIRSKISQRQLRRKLNILKEEIEDMRISNTELKSKLKEMKYPNKKTGIKFNKYSSEKLKSDPFRKSRDDTKKKTMMNDMDIQPHFNLEEYRSFISEQIQEYKKAIHHLKNKCALAEK